MSLKPSYKMKSILYYFIMLVKFEGRTVRTGDLAVARRVEDGEVMSLKLDLEVRETVKRPRVLEKAYLGVPSQGSELKGYPVLEFCTPG